MQHKTLENGRWAEMSFIDQMANIGSEIHRTSVWKKDDSSFILPPKNPHKPRNAGRPTCQAN